MLLLLLLFSYTLFAQEADQNPNSLTYKQYVKERQQQQLLLNTNTPRAALDYDDEDDEIDGLLRQLQGMANKAKKFSLIVYLKIIVCCIVLNLSKEDL